MARKSQTLEATLEALAAARAAPASAQRTTLLRRALAGRSSHAAAKSAEVAGEVAADEVVPDLIAAFDRFMVNPAKTDPGCAAKEAIAEALQQMGVAAGDLYRRGIAHRQMEPVWGGRVDTAARLRGVCGIAMARIRDSEAVAELAVLLADPEPEARRLAAQALAYNGDEAAVPLLRYKTLAGDKEPEVLTDAIRALLELDPARSLDFVAKCLNDERPEVAEAAGLALGGSRLGAAFEVLRDWWTSTGDPNLKACAALALAMLRKEQAIEFLLDLVGGESVIDARHALAGLAIYRHDETVRQRVEDAVAAVDDPVLRRELDRLFDSV